MKTRKRLGAEARREKAIQRLGADEPKCCVCGESDPRCLQLHHIAGKAFGDERAIVCANDHCRATDMQKDHPDPLGHTRNKIECIAHFLLGLADLLDLVVVKLKEFALYLIEEVAPRFSDEGGAAA